MELGARWVGGGGDCTEIGGRGAGGEGKRSGNQLGRWIGGGESGWWGGWERKSGRVGGRSGWVGGRMGRIRRWEGGEWVVEGGLERKNG